MSDIIQTGLQKLFVMVCGLTATPVVLLCLITYKQTFNESMLFSLYILCVCIIYLFEVKSKGPILASNMLTNHNTMLQAVNIKTNEQ